MAVPLRFPYIACYPQSVFNQQIFALSSVSGATPLPSPALQTDKLFSTVSLVYGRMDY